MYRTSYLMHHGVKGMKWGVRHDRPSSGRHRNASSTKSHGQKATSKWGAAKSYSYDAVQKHKKAVRRALITTAAISAAAIVGVETYKYGLMKSDRILKAGTTVQNIATPGRSFKTPFYGVDNAADMAYYAKHFTTKDTTTAAGRNIATKLMNKSEVRIAGKDTMDRAYRNAYGNNPIKREIFYRRLGGLQPYQKAKFNRELIRQGYGGHKDINDMQFLFGGNTPVVYFGTKSGFSPINASKINIKEARKVRVLTGVGKRTLIESGAISLGGASTYGAYKLSQKKKRKKNS